MPTTDEIKKTADITETADNTTVENLKDAFLGITKRQDGVWRYLDGRVLEHAKFVVDSKAALTLFKQKDACSVSKCPKCMGDCD